MTDFDLNMVICTYDGSKYKVYVWDLLPNEIYEQESREGFWYVHSSFILNKREVMLGFGNMLCIQDLRKRKATEILRVQDINNDRILSATFMPSRKEICLSKRIHFDIHDFRKPSVKSNTIRHMCEESPPTILQTTTFCNR